MKIVLSLVLMLFALPLSGGGAQAAEAVRGRTAYILAVSWQPGFCETQPGKPECVSQTPARADARQFSLHGLWKQRASYCGVAEAAMAADKAGRWRDRPALPLSPETAGRLKTAMPGMQSGLERHEWIKHGSCSGLDAEAYFRRSLDLLDALNASPVAALFAGRIGRTLTADEIRAAFDSAFGKGAADRVKMRCARDGERRVITELTIGLSPSATGTASLAEAIAGAGSTGFGCDSGVVDAAGLQ